MESYQFFQSLLLRTPLYTLQQFQDKTSASFLEEDQFKTAILIASQSLFDELEKRDFNWDCLTRKQQYTVQKYINRASFRSTPFGLFSGFSLAAWGNEHKAILSPTLSCSLKLDYGLLYMLWQYQVNKAAPPIKYQTNPTFFFNHIDFRYSKNEVANGKEANFSMIAFEKCRALKKILNYCLVSRTYDEILLYIINVFSVSIDSGNSYLTDLIEGQVLITDAGPQVIGDDNTALLFSQLLKNHPRPNIQNLANQLTEAALFTPINLVKVRQLVKQFMGLTPEQLAKNYFYALSKRKILQGSIDVKYQQHVRDGLYCLNILTKTNPIADLDSFKESFIKKYDSAEVPLLEALDPQFGIGYGSFAKMKVDSILSEPTFSNFAQANELSEENRNKLAAMFLGEWQGKNATFSQQELIITDEQLGNLSLGQENGVLPPTMAIIFRPIGDEIFLECLGGSSALSMIGRFSFCSDVFNLSKEIAQKEQEMNPDVIFAEIVHVCNLHTANINRRPHLRDYEIPVLTPSSLQPGKQISLSDLIVSVVGEEVILRSKRHQKVIVPRLSTAFNYTKNAFPVFRFLCDIQNQNLKIGLSFSLSSLLPGLSFYPRVKYRSCVLQLAEWHLEAKQFPKSVGIPCLNVHKLFMEVVQRISLPRFFTYAIGDMFLVVDCQNMETVMCFLQELRGKTSIVLREFPFTTDQSVQDIKGRVFLAQHVACLYATKKVYSPSSVHKNRGHQKTQSSTTAKWVYFKIYCHPLSSNVILRDYLFQLIYRLVKANSIEEWFWVRYNDPDYHLRFRLKVTANKKSHVLQLLCNCLNKLMVKKLVYSFHANIYRQEIRRYTTFLMSSVETVFKNSSAVIGAFFINKKPTAPTDDETWLEAVVAMHNYLSAFEFCDEQKISLARQQFDQFFIEFNRPKNLKLEMDVLYRGFYEPLVVAFANQQRSRPWDTLTTSILTLADKARNQAVAEISIEQLAIDLIHMHVNRLFAHDQRYFEMVGYYLLHRTLSTQVHKRMIPS